MRINKYGSVNGEHIIPVIWDVGTTCNPILKIKIDILLHNPVKVVFHLQFSPFLCLLVTVVLSGL